MTAPVLIGGAASWHCCDVARPLVTGGDVVLPARSWLWPIVSCACESSGDTGVGRAHC